MERIQDRRKRGLTTTGLRIWGLLFVALGVVGTGIIQNRILGIGAGSGADLLAVLESSPEMMSYATMAVVMQVLETCAVPIFAFLLTEGMAHTSSHKAYLLRVLALAAISELPYNMVVSGRLLDFSSRNPVFGVVFAMISILFCRQYDQKNVKHFLIRVMVTVCAALWCAMLRISFGGAMVVISSVLWAYRLKPTGYRTIAGATAAIVCSMGSLLFMATPMSFLAVLLYNGEEGDTDRKINYGAYPVILVITAVAGMLLV